MFQSILVETKHMIMEAIYFKGTKMIYKKYKKMADFMTTLLGNNTEIVLHDFSNLEHSIVYILNGHITNRKIGDAITDLLLKFLNKNSDIEEEFLCNYISKSSNGKTLHSSTYFIFDDDKKLIGALCTNTDYSDYNQAITLLKGLLPNSSTLTNDNIDTASLVIENFYTDQETLTLNKIQEEINKIDISPLRMTQDEKQQIVSSLHKIGIFMLKGSVQETAIKLESSEASIYRYIRNIKNNKI